MNKIAAAMSILVAGGALAGCSSHHHHHDTSPAPQPVEHVDEYIVVRDEHGWNHRGWYDSHGDWHGGYYDEHRVFHDDEHDWGRHHDPEFDHRPKRDWN